MITIHEILNAWVFLRKHNSSIPDDVLDFIKDSAIMVLKDEELLKQLEKFRYKRYKE